MPKWMRPKSQTEKITRAFWEFLPTLHDRLKEKRDLPAISTILSDLAQYLYSEIPEVSDRTQNSGLESLGLAASERFADGVLKLPPYRSKPESHPHRISLYRRGVRALGQLGIIVVSNKLVSFLTLWLVVFLISIVPLSIGMWYLGIKVDSTILAAIITGAAAGATAITMLRSRGKNQEL